MSITRIGRKCVSGFVRIHRRTPFSQHHESSRHLSGILIELKSSGAGVLGHVEGVKELGVNIDPDALLVERAVEIRYLSVGLLSESSDFVEVANASGKLLPVDGSSGFTVGVLGVADAAHGFLNFLQFVSLLLEPLNRSVDFRDVFAIVVSVSASTGSGAAFVSTFDSFAALASLFALDCHQSEHDEKCELHGCS